jgi:hypothetical protein
MPKPKMQRSSAGREAASPKKMKARPVKARSRRNISNSGAFAGIKKESRKMIIPLIEKLIELLAGESSFSFANWKKAQRNSIAHGYIPLMERYSGEISEIVLSISSFRADTTERRRNRNIFCF